MPAPSPMAAHADPGRKPFLELFRQHRSAVRRARWLRSTLGGATAGLLLGALLAAAAWWGAAPWRAAWVGLGLLGALLGYWAAARRTLSDDDLGLYLDARLGSRDEVTAALTEPAYDASPAARSLFEHVQARATALLREARADTLRPKVFSIYHYGAPLAAAVIIAFSWFEPPHPKTATPPGETRPLALSGLEGFEPIKQLSQLKGVDAEQNARLQAIAEAAERLEDELEAGAPQREVLAEMAKLRDSITAELGRLGNERNRAGLAAAVEALRRNDATRSAARALGEGDLVRFDQEMKELAQQAEKHDRDAAQKALTQAEQAAQQFGAEELAKELHEQQRRLQAGSHMAELLKQLETTLSKEPASELSANRKPNARELDPETTHDLSQALENALKQLDPAQRKRLAERLKQGIEDGAFDFDPAKGAKLEQMAEQLSTPEGTQKLAESLRRLSEPSGGAKRQQQLSDALEGLGRAQGGLRKSPIPLPQTGLGSAGPQRGRNNKSSPSPGRNGARGQHDGQSQPVEAESLRAKSSPRFDLEQPLLEASRGRAPARAGETANARGISGLEAVQAGELLGVEHAPVPAEYREQVSRYFSPE